MKIRISSYVLNAVGVFIILLEKFYSIKVVKSIYIARKAKLNDMITKIKNDLLSDESENVYVTYEAANLLDLDKSNINLIVCDEAKKCFNIVRKVKNAKNKQGWKNVLNECGFRVYRNDCEQKIKEPKYDIYTDGSWDHKTRKGGWAYIILKDGRVIRKHKGCENNTTSNRMELKAAIEALHAVKRKARVTLYTDSKYLVNTMTKGWKKNCNEDLWKELDTVCAKRKVKWKWVKGHNGDKYNEMVDAIAKEARLDNSDYKHRGMAKEGLDIYIDSKYGKKQYSVYRGKKLVDSADEKVTDVINIENTTKIIKHTFKEVLKKYKKGKVTVYSSNLALDKMVKEIGLPNNVKFELVNYGTILERVQHI